MIVKHNGGFNFEADKYLLGRYTFRKLKQHESFPRLEILYIFTRKKKNDPDTIYCPETRIQ